MSNTTKGTLIFLFAFGVVSMAMLFDGVSRMKRNGAPPFAEGLVTSVDFLPRPPQNVVKHLDASRWRIGAWVLAAAVLGSCVALAFRSERLVAAFSLLLLWAVASGILGFWVWLYSVFHKFTP